MAQIIDFAAARAALVRTVSAPALQAVRKPATGRRTLTPAQSKRRDDVRAKARAAL